MSTQNPRILISCALGNHTNYANAIASAGGTPCVAYCPPVSTEYDGLLLCGGDDVDPAFFGQEDWASEGIDRDRDEAELALAKAWLNAGKPILGICRGMQILNIATGGDLLQDIGDPLHHYHTRAPGTRDKVHPVHTVANSALSRLFGAAPVVNSAHHQALGKIGEDWVVTAWSESGLAEGIEHPHRPALAMQCHPERMSFGQRRPDAADAAPLFDAFLALCSGQRRQW